MSVSYALAWLLPLLAGSGLVGLLGAGRRFRGDGAVALGAGWVVGVFVAAAGARAFGGADALAVTARVAPWLGAFGVLAWIAALLRLRVAPATRAGEPAERRPLRAGGMRAALFWLLLAAIVVRVLTVADEAALRPVFPWDAWAAWAIKAKNWMLLGHVERYVPVLDWLADPLAPTRTAATWNYPELLAWLEVWFAGGAGGWNEPLVDLAWCGALVAFALAAYGYARGFGLGAGVAIALVYAFVSLPLIDAHVALAGYADLWVAVTLGLASLAWARWLAFRERGQWWLGVALALCLPAIKLEGAIWLLIFSAVVVLDLLPRRWRWGVAGLVAALAVLGVVLGGFVLPMLGLGLVHVAWGDVTVPTLGAFELGWHPVGAALLASLFTLPNWHLFWYVLPALVLVRGRVLLEDHAARLFGLFVVLQLAFLFLLFFFTEAAAWAQDFTSANRLILQIVPSLFAFAMLLLRTPRPVRRFQSGWSVAR